MQITLTPAMTGWLYFVGVFLCVFMMRQSFEVFRIRRHRNSHEGFVLLAHLILALLWPVVAVVFIVLSTSEGIYYSLCRLGLLRGNS